MWGRGDGSVGWVIYIFVHGVCGRHVEIVCFRGVVVTLPFVKGQGVNG